jgi:tetratricopeptide (TPR) repeat protein
MSIKEKIPLINNNSKKIRLLGYILYAYIVLSILGSIAPTPDAEVDTNTIQPEEVTPKSVDDWYIAAGNIEPQNEDEARKKIEYCQHVLDADPNNVSALWRISYTYHSDLDDNINAMKYLNTILQLQPRNVYFLDYKSTYLDDLGQKEEAMAVQDEIIGIATDGKTFSDNEWGSDVEQCGEFAVLGYAWAAKGMLVGNGLGPEYVDKSREYFKKSDECKGLD